MAATLEQVVKQLTDSGIIAPGKLEPFIPPKADPKTVEELVQALVKSENLTKFQAQHVAAGKTKSLILGEYTILDKIGAGGMGQVYMAQHRRMKRLVAIKMLPPATTKDAAAIARFEREVEAAAKLEHPNIVTAHDAGQANGAHFLVMQFVDGKDLSALVKKDGPFSVAKSVNYILQAARGLEFAHSEGVVHRDIKPANLLLDKKGVVKILDMGLARIEAGQGVAAQAELTGTGAIMGTVDYMAPEQGLSTKHADARADIYSLGCTLHYLLVGKAAYDGETVAAKLLAHHTHAIPDLRQLRDEVPEQVETVFKKMVAKKIEDRYQTMTEVVAELERCRAALNAAASSSTSVWQAQPSDQESDLSIAFAHAREHLIPRMDTEEFKPKTKPLHKARPKLSSLGLSSGRRRPVLIGLVAAGVLGVGILAAVIVIKMRTQDGTLIVEVNQPDAIVQVLDQEGKVEISQPGGLTPVSISVVPGKHRIRVEKDGFATIADNIDIESGGKLDIKARLVPKAKQVAGAKPWETPAFQAWTKTVAAMPAEKQIEAVAKKLVELNPGFDGKVLGYGGKGTPRIENGMVTEIWFITDNVTDISPVRSLVGLKILDCSGSSFRSGTLFDLSPLRGMPLTNFLCLNSQVADLSPLQGMPLTSLRCDRTLASSLSPLQGMKLTYLNCVSTNVSDLSPLHGMPLTMLICNNTPVSDLLPLAGCESLQSLIVAKTNVTAAGVAALQKALPDCKIEWPTEGQFYGQPVTPTKPITNINDPAFQAWMKTVAALPAEKQIEAVSKKLVELNPGFDGKLTDFDGTGTPKIAGGVVTELGFFTDNVTDISPVRALAGLMNLNCSGSSGSKGKLFDLLPLRGMPLKHLACHSTQVSDLSPLKQMKLKILSCDRTQISDLSPLQGMPLTYLSCYSTKISDLSPLSGMPLNILRCYATQASDLSPLEGMGLSTFLFTPQNITKGMDAIRQMKSLEVIGFGMRDNQNFPPAEFWKKYDAGEFGKPAAPAKLAYLDPAFQQWVKATQALPAEQQIEAVSKKLVELNPGFDGKVGGSYSPQGWISDLPKIENEVVTEFGFLTDNVTDLSPVRALVGLKDLRCVCSAAKGKLSDLSPLEGMSLTRLYCHNTQITDLSPLEGMKLAGLYCTNTKVSDLSPLRGMPLSGLSLSSSRRVSDLSPLQECKSLKTLQVINTKVTAAGVADLQKALPNCKIEWDGAAKAATAQPTQPWNTPAFQQWVKATQALPAEQQIEAVSKKLMELNPGFDGKVTGVDGASRPKIENGVVRELGFLTDNVTDVSPARAFAGLKVLNCNASAAAKARFSNLSPLEGMPLTQFRCENTKVSDLSPLREMSLTSLSCGGTNVSDLSPLLGMRLLFLNCGSSLVSDLSPLEGMNLLNLILTPKNITNGLDVVRQMKSLKIICLRNDGEKFPPAEFWKKYDAGEFGKPTPHPSPLPLDMSSGQRPPGEREQTNPAADTKHPAP